MYPRIPISSVECIWRVNKLKIPKSSQEGVYYGSMTALVLNCGLNIHTMCGVSISFPDRTHNGHAFYTLNFIDEFTSVPGHLYRPQINIRGFAGSPDRVGLCARHPRPFAFRQWIRARQPTNPCLVEWLGSSYCSSNHIILRRMTTPSASTANFTMSC